MLKTPLEAHEIYEIWEMRDGESILHVLYGNSIAFRVVLKKCRILTFIFYFNKLY